MTYQRSPHILQTPSADHCIIACYQESCQHAHIAYQSPGLAIRQCLERPRRISPAVATYDKFANHTGDAQQKHTSYINDDEHGTAVLSSHIGEAPHVPESDSRTCRRQYHPQFRSKIGSFSHFLTHNVCKSTQFK